MATELLCVYRGIRRNPKPQFSALLDWGKVRKMRLFLKALWKFHEFSWVFGNTSVECLGKEIFAVCWDAAVTPPPPPAGSCKGFGMKWEKRKIASKLCKVFSFFHYCLYLLVIQSVSGKELQSVSGKELLEVPWDLERWKDGISWMWRTQQTQHSSLGMLVGTCGTLVFL